MWATVRPARRAAVILVALAVLLLGIGLPLAPATVQIVDAHPNLEVTQEVVRPAATDNFTVNMTDTPRYVPSALTGVHAGDNVSVTLRNVGVFPHTFTLLKEAGIVLNTSWSPAQLDSFFNTNGSLVNVSVAPGATGYANFSIPSTARGGTFEFVSVIPFQFQAGMIGSLQVSAGTPTASLTDTATSSLSFVPGQLQVNAAVYPVTIEVSVTDVGSLVHTWTLSALANVVLSPSNFTTFFAAHAPALNLMVSNPGQTVNGTFLISSPGIYQYICTEPGHFAAGMFGFLYVGVAPPPVAAPPSTAIVQVGILAGAGTLVGVAVVLAFASNYVGRFPPKAPAHH